MMREWYYVIKSWRYYAKARRAERTSKQLALAYINVAVEYQRLSREVEKCKQR